jgi:hypothetical protein
MCPDDSPNSLAAKKRQAFLQMPFAAGEAAGEKHKFNLVA